MRLPILSVVPLVLAGGVLRAEAPKPAPNPDDGRPEEWRTVRSEWTRALDSATTEVVDRLAAPVLESVRRAPRDEAGLQVLADLMAYCKRQNKATSDVLGIVTADYAGTESVAQFLGQTSLRLTEIPASQELMERVVATNPSRSARAEASWVLAEHARHKVGPITGVPPGQSAAVKSTLEMYAKLAAEYGDVKVGRSGVPARDLVQERMGNAFAQPIGEPLPGLAGETLDGSTDTLARYKGKVVVLELWATWCGPCVKMIPDQRALVEKFKHEPFALISVNLDEDKKAMESFLKATPMPWTHWRWGKSGFGTGKPAPAGMFKTNFVPNILVIDAAGVVRYKQVRGPELASCVEECLKELKGKPPAE